MTKSITDYLWMAPIVWYNAGYNYLTDIKHMYSEITMLLLLLSLRYLKWLVFSMILVGSIKS